MTALPGEDHLGECELCGDTFPIRELEIGPQVLCGKCRANGIEDVRDKHDAEFVKEMIRPKIC
jgi:hypothetical protein